MMRESHRNFAILVFLGYFQGFSETVTKVEESVFFLLHVVSSNLSIMDALIHAVKNKKDVLQVVDVKALKSWDNKGV